LNSSFFEDITTSATADILQGPLCERVCACSIFYHRKDKTGEVSAARRDLTRSRVSLRPLTAWAVFPCPYPSLFLWVAFPWSGLAAASLRDVLPDAPPVALLDVPLEQAVPLADLQAPDDPLDDQPDVLPDDLSAAHSQACRPGGQPDDCWAARSASGDLPDGS
jgi:hypothetical protein